MDPVSNQPPPNPDDGVRNQNYPQATILYLDNGTITDQTLRDGNGLAVRVKLPTTLTGKPVTFQFYMNGVDPVTGDPKYAGPPDPNYSVAATIDTTGIAKTALPTALALGFPGDSFSFVDYLVTEDHGFRVYGPYPTASALTNT
jgi:hypothetical protein